MKTTVIHHSADFDGIFCREIARKFLPDAELIGWDFSDPPLAIPTKGRVYIMDLPADRVFGVEFKLDENLQCVTCHIKEGEGSLTKGIDFDEMVSERLIWIDHHATSIASHPKYIPGYRIDGVAACRLAWQWFCNSRTNYGKCKPDNYGPMDFISLLTKEHFVNRTVEEPLAVRLAGEYDIWDKRDPRAELFQLGLKTMPLEPLWDMLLVPEQSIGIARDIGSVTVDTLLENGPILQYAREQEYAEVIKTQGFDMKFEGLTFLACNSHELDIRSHLFTAGIKPHHDALLGFTWGGKDWRVSMYHAPGKEHHDLSIIAKANGGGGHRGACGFRCKTLPFSIRIQ